MKKSELRRLIREEIQNLKESQYELYHPTYTSAIDTAIEYAKKRGYEVDSEEVGNIVGLQSKRPSSGKSTRVSIPLYKNGKLQRKALQIIVYNRDTNRNTFELTTYIR